jgi:putative cardiolipin synthase
VQERRPTAASNVTSRPGVRRRCAPLLLILALSASGCATLPPAAPQPPSFALPPAQSGALATVHSQVTDDLAPDESGFLALTHNQSALAWRLTLADHATRSIDAQYYIWDDDEAANLLFERFLKAADRGVRVRLLVDDLLLAAKDASLSAISHHPNFEIRLYNPGAVRESTVGRLGEFMLNFKSMNRRMHNKLFVVDNRVAIIGGRNIGNPYFGLADKFNFLDLDVLTVGPVVEEISSAFDAYWNAELAYPTSAMKVDDPEAVLARIREELAEYLAMHRETLASYRVEPGQGSAELRQLPDRLATGEAHFLQDQPVDFDGQTHRLADMLAYLAEPSHTELIMVSPYLIPVSGFLEDLAELSTEGVQTRLLTGSMGSNNHTVAHSHYKKYRRRILDTGAELYEFRHDPAASITLITDVPPVQAGFVAMHIKALVGDRQRCFIGSLNLDPRAIEINTENGLYIQSPVLCGDLADYFDTLMNPDNAWRVRLGEDDRLHWDSSDGSVTLQPARGFGQRIADFFYRLLPIESQL